MANTGFKGNGFVSRSSGGGGGLATGDIDTLAELNAILVDATLDDISGTRDPSFPVLAPDGSLAAPSYSFANATNTGLILASSEMRVVVAGALRAHFAPTYIRMLKQVGVPTGVLAGDNGLVFGTDTDSGLQLSASDTIDVVAGGNTGITIEAAKVTISQPLDLDIGSDATGDVYYRDAGGAFQRLAIGSETDLLAVSSGIPAWTTAPAAGVSNPYDASSTPFDIQHDGGSETPNVGLLLSNDTASVTGAGNEEWPPMIKFSGSRWTGVASEAISATIRYEDQGGGGTPYGVLTFATDINESGETLTDMFRCGEYDSGYYGKQRYLEALADVSMLISDSAEGLEWTDVRIARGGGGITVETGFTNVWSVKHTIGSSTVTLGTDVVPSTNNARDLGSPALAWQDVYFDGVLEMGASASIEVNNARVPFADIGSIHFDNYASPATAQTNATATDWKKADWFTTDGGVAQGMTEAAASDKITLTNAGKYLVTLTVSADAVTVASVMGLRIYWNGGAVTGAETSRDVSASAISSITLSCVVDATAGGNDVEVYFNRQDSATQVSFDVYHSKLIVSGVSYT